MTDVWGNPDGDQKNQDLVSDTENTNILRVSNVDNNDADRAAIFAKNSNTGANARALKVEGKADIIAVDTDNPVSTGLKIVNASSNANALGFALEGRGGAITHNIYTQFSSK